ncbi:ATP-binding protein [Variovorax sp. J22R133]|uniref:sensor histidine kinase n=1 Tax=Variovorax brevis TaxID=3053503 RepID=UPI002578126E|nr:ATP-binding protein [Variovorax sp. J22R133]MDM0113001.1 ATP-binding protein [Variovorax sp. J22R133]
MKHRLRSIGAWLLAWLLLSAGGAFWLARDGLRQLQDDFDTQARIAHRLLSQQVVQYDAVLATLALLGSSEDRREAESRLSSVYPSILAVVRRDASQAWPDARLASAEAQSLAARRAQLGPIDLTKGRYWLVMAAQPVSYALEVDLASTVPWSDWPMDPKTSPVRLALHLGEREYLVQPGSAAGGWWHFAFRKHLASASQDFDVAADRDVRLRELPWGPMTAWIVGVAVVLAGLRAWQRQRTERRRAEEMVRFGQVARLNALGELAAGMAHELNQPLTAVLANTQAARRLLDDASAEDLATARTAMGNAVDQARRAADVVGRLRRVIERPTAEGRSQALVLADVLQRALHLLEPEFARHGIAATLSPLGSAHSAQSLRAQGDPVAVEQIVHNLLVNAMQALAQHGAGGRRISVLYGAAGEGRCQVQVCDNGPGIPPETMSRIFEPFFSTREHGLGLGLSLCETLAQEMSGTLTVAPAQAGGACFTLTLPQPVHSA